MSKQRCLLILLPLLLGSLYGQIHLQSGFYGVVGDSKPVWQNRSNLNAELDLTPQLSLNISAKLIASDSLLADFPQKGYANSLLALAYSYEFIDIEAGYRNTLFASASELTLYPDWNASGYYTPTAQHQSQIAARAERYGFAAKAYAIHKHLRATPTEYNFDEFFNLIATQLPERGFDDIYYGAGLGYVIMPYLSLRAFTDVKQANFDEGDIYSVNSVGAVLSSEVKITNSSRIAGSFTYKNRQADYLAPAALNSYQSTLRFQQKLGTNLNGFISYVNNGCSDAKLKEFYFVSHQLRSQIQYSFAFDESQASYLLVGGRYSPENEANAAFIEAQSRIVNRLYGLAGYKNYSDSYSQYQGKIAWYFSPHSQCYLHYVGSDYTPVKSTQHYLGLGTSIYF